MKLLTVRAPWAQAIVLRELATNKDIENRTWPPNMIGRIGIHAGLKLDEAGLEALGYPPHLLKDRGKIIGTVEITSAHLENSPECLALGCRTNPWALWSGEGERPIWHWHLEHPREFVTPFPASGSLGLWEAYSPRIEHLLEIEEVVS